MKKHVLFIVENHAVPLDRRVWRQALAVKNWGYDVSVICCKEGIATASYEQIDGIDIYRHPMPFDSSWKMVYLLEYLNALIWEYFLAIRLYLKKPFHVIHAANPPDLIFLIAALFKPFGVKFVFDVHDLSPELFSARYARSGIIYEILVKVENLSCKLADAVIVTNQSYREILMGRHKTNSDKIFVVRNDPSVNEFFMPEIVPAKDGKRVILYLGSINPQDGVENLMEAVEHLVYGLGEKEIRCLVIGDGQAFRYVKQKVGEMRIETYVDLKGFVYDRAKIREYLNMADVCVEPAPDTDINRHSTFIKILEFMAAGKPIVAYDLKESRFSANDSAVFVEPGNVKDFALAIRDLLYNSEHRRQLGKSGQERIKSILNWENSLANMKNAYEYLRVTPTR